MFPTRATLSNLALRIRFLFGEHLRIHRNMLEFIDCCALALHQSSLRGYTLGFFVSSKLTASLGPNPTRPAQAYLKKNGIACLVSRARRTEKSASIKKRCETKDMRALSTIFTG